MDAVPSPMNDDILTYNKVVRGLLRSKCFALVFCIAGTAILFFLPLDFLESKLFQIALPSFLTGYIFVNLASIWTALHGRVDLLADFNFASIGIVVNNCCGLYLFYYWVDWIIVAYGSEEGGDGAAFLILCVTCFLNAIAMGFQIHYSFIEKKRRETYRNTHN